MEDTRSIASIPTRGRPHPGREGLLPVLRPHRLLEEVRPDGDPRHGKFFDELAETWRNPRSRPRACSTSSGSGAMPRASRSPILATAAPAASGRSSCCGLPDGPSARGTDLQQGRPGAGSRLLQGLPDRDRHMDNAMMTKRGTSVVFLGGGVRRTSCRSPHQRPTRHGNVDARRTRRRSRSRPTTRVFGGLGGATLATECISWGKEGPRSDNVMCFADVTLALPIICQGLAEAFGAGHRRARRSR